MQRSLSFAMQRVCSQTKRFFLATKSAPTSRLTATARVLLRADEEDECVRAARVARRQQRGDRDEPERYTPGRRCGALGPPAGY